MNPTFDEKRELTVNVWDNIVIERDPVQHRSPVPGSLLELIRRHMMLGSWHSPQDLHELGKMMPELLKPPHIQHIFLRMAIAADKAMLCPFFVQFKTVGDSTSFAWNLQGRDAGIHLSLKISYFLFHCIISFTIWTQFCLRLLRPESINHVNNNIKHVAWLLKLFIWCEVGTSLVVVFPLYLAGTNIRRKAETL